MKENARGASGDKGGTRDETGLRLEERLTDTCAATSSSNAVSLANDHDRTATQHLCRTRPLGDTA